MQKIKTTTKKTKTLGVMRLESKINNFPVPFEERRDIWSGFNVRVCGNVCVRERARAPDEACNAICHVFMGGPFLLHASDQAFSKCLFFSLTNGSLHAQGSLSRIFTVFTKAAKKKKKRRRLEIQFGTTWGANKARPPQNAL